MEQLADGLTFDHSNVVTYSTPQALLWNAAPQDILQNIMGKLRRICLPRTQQVLDTGCRSLFFGRARHPYEA